MEWKQFKNKTGVKVMPKYRSKEKLVIPPGPMVLALGRMMFAKKNQRMK